jgi:hypothetical protein
MRINVRGVLRTSVVSRSAEEELEKALAKAEARSFSKILLSIWTADKSSKWFIIILAAIFLLYLGAGSPIAHYRGDFQALNQGVSQLADILEQVEKEKAGAAVRLQLGDWARGQPRRGWAFPLPALY